MHCFKQVAIIGPGLLGASLAMACKKRLCGVEVRVWARRKETLAICLKKNWCDSAHWAIAEAVEGSDLVVVCTPVESIANYILEILSLCGEKTLVTDVGSVKGSICRTAQEQGLGNSSNFIGSHPMAGSEKSGMDFATGHLFEDRPCIVTPLSSSNPFDVEKISRFWTDLGMKVFLQSPEEHDEIVANFSHFPHLIASSMAEFLSHLPTSWNKMAGQGFGDATRIAQGDSDLWCQIMKMNQSQLAKTLEKWMHSIQEAKSYLEQGKWEKLKEYLEKGSAFRKKWEWKE